MSRFGFQRAVYHLSLRSPFTERHPGDPASALAELRRLTEDPAIADLRTIDLHCELDAEEIRIIETGDVAAMYRRGIHPNTIRNFAGNFGIDYVKQYERAGLRHA